MMCGKIPYESKAEALKDIKFIYSSRKYRNSHAGRKDGRKFTSYQCNLCGLWHLTTRSKRKYD